MPDPGARPVAPAGLSTMKRRATGLLVLMTLVFLVARWFEPDHHWLGYVRATAEAAMVGGLADWFAVTALFRHPLGIPVPHTAIVPTRKNELGRSLGGFIETHFLDPDLLVARLHESRAIDRLGRWLLEPTNARAVAERLAAALAGAAEVLDDDRVAAAIEDLVRTRLEELPAAPLLGNLIDTTMDDRHHVVLVDALFRGADQFIDANLDAFRSRLHAESPWWVPMTIDDRVFRRIVEGVKAFIDEVGADPDHPIRRHLDTRSRAFARQLRTDPELAARGEELKVRVLDHPDVRAWTASIWSDAKSSLSRAAADPDSDLVDQLTDSVVGFATSLRRDPTLRVRIDRWVGSAVAYLAREHGHQVSQLISSTVERWDATEASHRVEFAVGRDLQFIRINGTLVGGLAGLVIYSVSELVVG